MTHETDKKETNLFPEPAFQSREEVNKYSRRLFRVDVLTYTGTVHKKLLHLDHVALWQNLQKRGSLGYFDLVNVLEYTIQGLESLLERSDVAGRRVIEAEKSTLEFIYRLIAVFTGGL